MSRDPASNEGLLPPIHWWPMFFAVVIVFFPLAWLNQGHASTFDWQLIAFAAISSAALLATVACWRRRLPILWVPVVLVVIGFALAPDTSTAQLYFLFAAVICPWAVDGHVQRSVTLAVLLVFAELFQSLLEPVRALRTVWLLDVPIFTIGNVAVGVWIVRKMLGMRQLGRVAVRERITRDLHTILGEALALIAHESEQAGRLLALPAGTAGARRGIANAERISRRALADLRQTIGRYRSEVPGVAPATADGAATPIDWWPMLLTIYIAFLPVGFWRAGGGSTSEWVLLWLGVLAFLVLVALALVSWQRRRPFFQVVPLLTLLGIAFAHLTPSAMIFIMFAAALAPLAVNGDVGRTTWLVIGLIVVELFIGAWNSFLQPDAAATLQEWWWIAVPTFTAASAAGYLWAVRMSLRHLALAKVAERERIARDLHDVMGHTLSLMTLKSELAGRLLTERQNNERAREEITDVERIARQALADVKRTIVGGCVETIDAAFERATSTLRTAGITVECRRETLCLDSGHESILGLALCEAVTNVVRHSEARTCSIRLQQGADLYVLEVQDDGCGGTECDGLGLRGMRERIEALGGSVLREITTGTRLTVCLPATPIPI